MISALHAWALMGWNLALAADADGSADGADAAEYVRLSDEISALARRNAWPGVERAFTRLLETGMKPAFNDWVYAAQAAKALGDVTAVKARLQSALQLRQDRAVVDWLWAIEGGYGTVALTCDEGAPFLLVFEGSTFDPDAQRAIRWAQAAVHDRCTFTGLLPVGYYRMHDQQFEVAARAPVQTIDLRGVHLSASKRRALKRTWSAFEQ